MSKLISIEQYPDYDLKVMLYIGRFQISVPEESVLGNEAYIRVKVPSIDSWMGLYVGREVDDNKIEILKSEYPWKELK